MCPFPYTTPSGAMHRGYPTPGQPLDHPHKTSVCVSKDTTRPPVSMPTFVTEMMLARKRLLELLLLGGLSSPEVALPKPPEAGLLSA